MGLVVLVIDVRHMHADDAACINFIKFILYGHARYNTCMDIAFISLGYNDHAVHIVSAYL